MGHPQRGVNCASCSMGVRAGMVVPDAGPRGGHGLRCLRAVYLKTINQWIWGHVWQKGLRKNVLRVLWHRWICLCMFSAFIGGAQIFRELGFAHLVGLEHGLKCMSASSAAYLLHLQYAMWWVGRQVSCHPPSSAPKREDSPERDGGDTCKLYLSCTHQLC